MSEKTQLALTHISGIAVTALVVWLSVTVLKPYPDIGHALIGSVALLYGKLGFAPIKAVIEEVILKRLTPNQVDRVIARASTRPPAAGPDDDGSSDVAPTPASPFAKAPSARPAPLRGVASSVLDEPRMTYVCNICGAVTVSAPCSGRYHRNGGES